MPHDLSGSREVMTRALRRILPGVLAILVGAVVSQGPGTAARADDVRVLAAGAVQKAMEPLFRTFEAKSGHRILSRFDTVGALKAAALAGELPHLILLSMPALEEVAAAGRLDKGSLRELGRTGVGVAVQLSGPPVDISTAEKLKETLLGAPSIVHADPARGATAGTHFRKVVAALGLTDTLAARITVVPFGGSVAGDVAAGKFALGISQATEIVPNKAVRFAGTLPEPYALWTSYGVGRIGPLTEAVSAFEELLLGDVGQAAFRSVGFELTAPTKR